MKARIKATGDVYTVVGITHNDPAYFPQDVFHLGNDKWYPYEDVELIGEDTTDWQQVRIQAAIAAMNIVKGAYNIHNDVERLVHHSVRIADALIEELKKGGAE